ncbi:MAG: gluconokinase, GntK/IdnK-type, partial [Cyclobacteriaceae bacterium]
MIVIIYGVTGCGKTTVGKLLAKKMNLPFFDGDHFHPNANKHKMNSGIPLTDENRIPWLENIAASIKEWEKGQGAVLACSALNEKYRRILKVVPDIRWILLAGSKSLIMERLSKRVGHFMNPALLDSQLATLESPNYGLKISIKDPPEKMVEEIFKKMKEGQSLSEFGMIGMGVMGKSLALNLADQGINISIYNRHVKGTEEKVAQKVLIANPGYHNISPFDHLPEFIDSLSSPKKIMLMIPAGNAVDAQIEELLPYLEAGDLLIDGGNSFYKDTGLRVRNLQEKGILFVGAGVSGGEEGARKGPSIMPGGAEKGYQQVAPYFEKIAAKDFMGNPCTAYIGPDGAGHFVKMVHNSIEYGEMQVIAEIYTLLRFYLGLPPSEIADIFESWMDSDLGNYLLEITADILRKKEDDNSLLLDQILDQAA